MKTFGVGTKIYYDGMFGFIKGKVTEVRQRENGLDIFFRVTSKGHSHYKQGQILRASGHNVFPQDVTRLKKHFTFSITEDYNWQINGILRKD